MFLSASHPREIYVTQEICVGNLEHSRIMFFTCFPEILRFLSETEIDITSGGH